MAESEGLPRSNSKFNKISALVPTRTHSCVPILCPKVHRFAILVDANARRAKAKQFRSIRAAAARRRVLRRYVGATRRNSYLAPGCFAIVFTIGCRRAEDVMWRGASVRCWSLVATLCYASPALPQTIDFGFAAPLSGPLASLGD